VKKSNNKNSELYLNFFSYLIILLPIFLISGPFISDLSVSILAISSLFFIRNKKFFLNFFFIFFIIFWILIISSSLFSEYKLISIKSSFLYFRFILFSLFVWWILEENKKILIKIYIVLLFCFLILIFDSIFQYFNGSNIFNMKIVEENIVSSFFGEELKMGGFLMRLFPLLVALSFFFYKKKKHEKYLYISIIFILFLQITIFLSGERSSFFLFNFSILLFIIFLNDLKKIKILVFFLFLIILSLLVTIETPFKKRIVDLTFKDTQVLEKEKQKYIFSRQYHEHYLSAWNMFQDNILFGIGPKVFREKCKEKKYNFSILTCSTHPHNMPIQLLSETGIFSFFLYLTLNIIVWFNLFKNLYSKIFYSKFYLNNFQISLLVGTVIIIFPFTPNGNFFNNWLSIVFYYPAGFLLWSLKNSDNMYLNSLKKNTFFKKFILQIKI